MLARNVAPVVTAPWHTQAVFDITKMPEIAEWAAKLVKRLDADAVAVCGHSGLVVAGAVSYLARVPTIAVRKEGERDACVASCESDVSAMLPHRAERWVWLDDFISSGGTLRRSIERMHSERVIARPHPVAILSYRRMCGPNDLSVETLRLAEVAPRYDWSSVGPIPEYGFLPY